MPSLKEVKNRIKSVSSTRKITSAMKLVASSKLHHAQIAIENMLPYEQNLNKMMFSFMSEMQGDIISPYSEQRPIKKVLIIAYSSNSSLCGAFNANIIKELSKHIIELQKKGVDDIQIVPVGTKVAEKVTKMGYTFDSDNSSLIDKPNFSEASKLAQNLMNKFKAKEIDQVIMIYNHFHSTSKQVVETSNYLPIDLSSNHNGRRLATDYIVEPSKEELIACLIPKVLHLKIYTALLDSCASEHAARVIAMQTATDNADELLHDLTLTYNKTRQAAITTELLDIVGGSFQ